MAGGPAGSPAGASRAEANALASALGGLVRDALRLAGTTAASGGLPANWLQAALEAGAVDPAPALSLARQHPQLFDRALGLLAVAPHLPPLDRIATLRTVFDLAAALPGWSRARLLSQALPNLPPELLGQARQLAGSVADPYDRARLLAQLAECWPPGPDRAALLAQARQAARDVPEPAGQAAALGRLAAHLDADAPAALAEALTAARLVPDPALQARALAQLASQAPPGPGRRALQGEALSAARAVLEPEARAGALVAVAPALDDPVEQARVRAEAAALARALPEAEQRALTLFALVPDWPEGEESGRLLVEALSEAAAAGAEGFVAAGLAELAGRLPDAWLNEAVTLAQRLSLPYGRAPALRALARRLPPGPAREAVRAEALAAARALSDPHERAEALTALAAAFDGEMRRTLLRDALASWRIPAPGYGHLALLVRLAGRLPPGAERAQLLDGAEAAARASGPPAIQAEMLIRLAAHLPAGPERAAWLEHALDLAEGLAEPNEQARVLVRWLPMLAGPEAAPAEANRALGALLAAARSAPAQAAALPAAAQYLPAALLPEALAAARAVAEPALQARVLDELAAWLPDGAEREAVVREALAAAQAVDPRGPERAYLLLGLARHAADRGAREVVLAAALASARLVEPLAERAAVLHRLAPELPASLAAEALPLAQALPDPADQARLLPRLAARLPAGAAREHALQASLNAAGAVGDPDQRAAGLAAIAALWPEGEVHARLWDEALAALQAVEPEAARAAVLTAMLGHLPADRLPEAEQHAAATRDPQARTRLWLALSQRAAGPAQRDAHLRQALAAASAVPGAHARLPLLAELIEYLPAETWGMVLELACAASEAEPAADLLFFLAERWPAVSAAAGTGESELLVNTLRAFASWGPDQCLRAVSALLPAIEHVGGAAALRQVARALLDSA